MSHYNNFVAHYFRLAVRNPFLRDDVSKRWYVATTAWIDKLNADDKILIYKVYDNKRGGISRTDLDRIATLTTQFAKDMELC